MSRPNPHTAALPTEPPQPALTLRNLDGPDDFQAAVEMQQRTWGDDFIECVPPSIFMICRKLGGVAAGAFNAGGEMVGLVFGLTGLREGKLVHWSHMLAVREDLRNAGLGRRLKLFQRQQLEPLGVREILWTYDPLVARNAHLNLNRLGCSVREYVENLYGDGETSPLHRGIGTDRFVVCWDLTREPAAAPRDPAAWQDVPCLDLDDTECELPAVPRLCIEVPANVQQLKDEQPQTAARWRTLTRRAFPHYLARGYHVRRLQRDPAGERCWYELEAPTTG